MHGNGLVLKHEKPNKVYFLQFCRSNKQENNFKTLRGCLWGHRQPKCYEKLPVQHVGVFALNLARANSFIYTLSPS